MAHAVRTAPGPHGAVLNGVSNGGGRPNKLNALTMRNVSPCGRRWGSLSGIIMALLATAVEAIAVGPAVGVGLRMNASVDEYTVYSLYLPDSRALGRPPAASGLRGTEPSLGIVLDPTGNAYLAHDGCGLSADEGLKVGSLFGGPRHGTVPLNNSHVCDGRMDGDTNVTWEAWSWIRPLRRMQAHHGRAACKGVWDGGSNVFRQVPALGKQTEFPWQAVLLFQLLALLAGLLAPSPLDWDSARTEARLITWALVRIRGRRCRTRM